MATIVPLHWERSHWVLTAAFKWFYAAEGSGYCFELYKSDNIGCSALESRSASVPLERNGSVQIWFYPVKRWCI